MKRLSWLFSILILTSCGFHLRGLVDKPPGLNTLFIDIKSASQPLEPTIKTQLEAYQITIADSPQIANATLIILEEQHDQVINGVSSATGPRQYQLNYTLKFIIQSHQNTKINPKIQTIRITRPFTLNTNQILGSNAEANLMLKQIQEDAVRQLIARLFQFDKTTSQDL
jgi:LPS-assembly lipoprotein